MKNWCFYNGIKRTNAKVYFNYFYLSKGGGEAGDVCPFAVFAPPNPLALP